jgi:hypothetical protein
MMTPETKPEATTAQTPKTTRKSDSAQQRRTREAWLKKQRRHAHTPGYHDRALQDGELLQR